jgi:hypothetical protein
MVFKAFGYANFYITTELPLAEGNTVELVLNLRWTNKWMAQLLQISYYLQ